MQISYFQEKTSKCHSQKFNEAPDSPSRQNMFIFFFLKVGQEERAGGDVKLPAWSGSCSVQVGCFITRGVALTSSEPC